MRQGAAKERLELGQRPATDEYVAALEAELAAWRLSGERDEIVLPEDVALSGHPLSILSALVAAEGQPCSTRKLHATLYRDVPEGDRPALNIVKVYIGKLRAALDGYATVLTYPGRGYALKEDAIPKLRGDQTWHAT